MAEPKKSSMLINPNPTEAETLIEKALAARKTIIVVGNCQVDYLGRASSTLEPGERLLIIKQDGALLVHRPVGYEPVNWQPSGCVFHVQKKDGVIEIHGVRQKPRESVKVKFDSVFMVSALSLKDSGEFLLSASEEDMHKAILARPSLVDEDFRPISYEKKVEPGFVDVYGMDRNGKLVVIEVKRKAAGKDAAFQLARYIEAIREKADREIRGILVAPSLGKDVQRLLATLGLEFKSLDPKKCSDVLKKKAPGAKLETFFADKEESA